MPYGTMYMATLEVDDLRFIAGIADAMEKAKQWEKFTIKSVPGQAPGKGSPYKTLDNLPRVYHIVGGAEPNVEDHRGATLGLEHGEHP